jgi:hypothetical protein
MGESMGDLENLLPEDFKKRAIISGNEWILPYADALSAIEIATEHQIAILGIDAIDILPPGKYRFYVSDNTGYDREIKFAGNWEEYVRKMNSEGELWLKSHALGDGHGYSIASASEREFATLGADL